MENGYLKRIPIFLASPSNLSAERQLFSEIIEDANKLIAKNKGFILEPVIWEETLIGKGRPQEKINEKLKKCHLVVMLLWNKWGSPTGSYSSGFEEEYEVANENKKEIWLYFRDVAKDMLNDPGEQLKKVIAFRNKINTEKRYLYSNYGDENEWKDTFYFHLNEWLNKLRSEHSSVESETLLKSSQTIPIINEDDIEEIVQFMGEMTPSILIENQEIPYLKIETKDYLGCTLFSDFFGFSNGTYYTHSPQESYVPLDKLEKILKTFYATFRTGYELDNPSFLINQTCFKSDNNYSWFGYGLDNFVQALKEQSKRYTEAEIISPHHNEVASFVAIQQGFVFYVACQPSVFSKNRDLTLDHLQAGFIFEDVPFNNTKFIDFYNKTGLHEPDFIYHNTDSLNAERIKLETNKFNLKSKSFVVDRSFDGNWVSRIIFENPFYEAENCNEYLAQLKKIVVNLSDYHPLESNKNYFLRELIVQPIPYGNFGFNIIQVRGNW